MEKITGKSRLVFIMMGLASTIWFLIRVIPKPSRASYPCMRVAAPVMSGFVIYMLSLSGITLGIGRIIRNVRNARYLTAMLFVILTVCLTGVAVYYGSNELFSASLEAKLGPDDGPNQPAGVARGIFPGRVVWAWNPDATNENCTNSQEKADYYFKSENTNAAAVAEMLSSSLKKLSGQSTVSEAWDSFFRYHNMNKHNRDEGYKKGQKIFIKINQGTSRWMLTDADKEAGYYFPSDVSGLDMRRKQAFPVGESNPYVVLEVLKQLVNEAGVDQSDITVGDPMTNIYGHNFEVWYKAFPKISYTDKISDRYNRTLVHPTEKDLLFYSDKSQIDKLFDVIEEADYLINLSNLKSHNVAGISLSAKNHFGSQARETAGHLHYSLMGARGGIAMNGGYKKYRVLVDLMGSKYLGRNTMLYLVDGLFGGGASEIKPVVKYFMPPFNNDWSSSIFVSLDQVALESVCYDFLRTEWNGINKHNPVNNNPEICPSYNGVDDYLHQAADPSNWPEGIKYDPDGSGKSLTSLGVHEHWNNPAMKQYSRNLGRQTGIELVSIPGSLVKNETSTGMGSRATMQDQESFGTGISASTFSSVVVDEKNCKWFLTEAGILSYDDKKWALHNKNLKIPATDLRGLSFDISSYGSEVWIANATGATVATLPVDVRSGATTYHTGNSKIVSDNVRSIAVGKSALRWIGTDKGISAFADKKWLVPSYERVYPETAFSYFPITCMAVSPGGDTLYAGTEGAGVTRVFRDSNTDAISGASEFAQWGTILMPCDSVYSIFIGPKGNQWIGTARGLALHQGNKTLENWTVFTVENGLADNFIQAITMDKSGNIWAGTKNGLSVYNGSEWKSYRTENGLNSSNILCIAADMKGTIWIGTDQGVNSYYDGLFKSFR